MSKIILPLKRSDEQQAADNFLVLANDSRFRIMKLLSDTPKLSVLEIATQAQVSPSRVSDHLGILRRKGILTCEKEGRQIYYVFHKNQVVELCQHFVGRFDLDLAKLSDYESRELSETAQIQFLQVLASEGRCTIMKALNRRELTIKEILQEVFYEQQTISDHLQLLRKVRLVSATQEGRFVHCKLNPAVLMVFFKLYLSNFK